MTVAARERCETCRHARSVHRGWDSAATRYCEVCRRRCLSSRDEDGRAARWAVLAASIFATIVLPLILVAVIAGERVERRIEAYGVAFPPRVAIVVDASGSMTGKAPSGRTLHQLAVAEARWAAERLAADDGGLRFYSFAAALTADPQGWFATPDLDRLKAALGFLRAQTVEGNTDLAGAMREVLADQELDLGVVVVTDADPDGVPALTVASIAATNAARKNPATIAVVAVCPKGVEQESVGRSIAVDGAGCYIRVTERE